MEDTYIHVQHCYTHTWVLPPSPPTSPKAAGSGNMNIHKIFTAASAQIQTQKLAVDTHHFLQERERERERANL